MTDKRVRWGNGGVFSKLVWTQGASGCVGRLFEVHLWHPWRMDLRCQNRQSMTDYQENGQMAEAKRTWPCCRVDPSIAWEQASPKIAKAEGGGMALDAVILFVSTREEWVGF